LLIALALLVLVPAEPLAAQGLLDPLDASIAANSQGGQFGLDRATRVASLPRGYFDEAGSGHSLPNDNGAEDRESGLMVPWALGLMIFAGLVITAAGIVTSGRAQTSPRVLITH
jgi:hypothetical protein